MKDKIVSLRIKKGLYGEECFSEINKNINGKEYFLQISKKGYRCISYHPHYITTKWVKTVEEAIGMGDLKIQEYYEDRKGE